MTLREVQPSLSQVASWFPWSAVSRTRMEEQGWRSGESTRLPQMWSGFDSRTRRHMCVEFVVGSRPCSERFFSGYSGYSKFQFELESVTN